MTYSSQQVAKKLGITGAALSKYIKSGKVPKPESIRSGGMTIYLWTDLEITTVRQLLPKIKNGRKTRYQKQKTKPQPRAAAPHKKKK